MSIAIATYNGDKYLAEQLNSILAQTYKNIEIIISDDGSTDATIEIIRSYEKKFPVLKLVSNKNNRGIKKNFENAIKNCKGIFIALSDQDDLWMPKKIETLVNNIGDFSAIYHDSLFINHEGKTLNNWLSKNVNCFSGYDGRAFLFFNCVSGHAIMFHNRIIDAATPFPNARYHDWWLAFIAAENGGIKYLNEVLVHYRQHPNSQTDFLELKENISTKKNKASENFEWFTSCANVKNNHQAFFTQWANVYKNKQKHIWNIEIFKLLLFNLKIIFYISKKNTLSKVVNIIKRSWGNSSL